MTAHDTARGLLRSLTTKVGEAIDEYEAKVERARHSEEGKALVERSDQARQELDHLRAAFELERQKLDYELARKKLELRALEEQAARVNRQIGASDS